MADSLLSIREKTQTINQNKAIYGAFAEIGAGQETSRWFFRTRGASQTVAKAVSAYDMAVSDSIYGRESSGRYVCESRLIHMLQHEFDLTLSQLGGQRPQDTLFFAFGNTVAARSQKTGGTGQGWMGLTFLHEPKAAPSQVRLHIRLFDKHNTLQQETLGNVGVNLIYACYFLRSSTGAFLSSLKQDIEEARFEIDYISFSGPAFEHTDNIEANLSLVHYGLSKAVCFDSSAQPKQPTDLFFKKNILLFRGTYRPISNYHMDLMECAQHQFAKELNVSPDQIHRVAEIAYHLALRQNEFHAGDIKERIRLNSLIGVETTFTNLRHYHHLQPFITHSFCHQARLLLKVEELDALLNKESYLDCRGGVLEGLGQLFHNGIRILVSPSLRGQTVLDTGNYTPPAGDEHLYTYILDSGWIKGTKCLNQDHLRIKGEEIVAQIKAGQSDWQSLVPNEVAKALLKGSPFTQV